MPLVSLVYVSFASHDMSDDELREILEVARRKNKELNVTGMLLYRDGFFIQALEGERNKVDPLYDKIAEDPRHRNVLKVYETEIKHRAFSDWSMGFNKISDEQIAQTPGFTEYLEKPDESHFFKDQPSRATKLLEQFKNQTYF